MTACTAPGCGRTATLQWQRDADQVEADHAIDDAQAAQIRIHKHQLATATTHMLEARRNHTDAQAAAKAGDHRARAVLPTIADQVTAAEHAVDTLADAGPARIDPPATVTVAVFGCDTHKVDDDAATWLHQTGCLTDPPGQCACQPVQE